MQRLKSGSILRRFLGGHRFNPHQRRTLNPLPNHEDSQHDLVLVEGNACSLTAILNRPSALNALDYAMGHMLQKLYMNWEENPDVGFVMMKVLTIC